MKTQVSLIDENNKYQNTTEDSQFLVLQCTYMYTHVPVYVYAQIHTFPHVCVCHTTLYIQYIPQIDHSVVHSLIEKWAALTWQLKNGKQLLYFSSLNDE